MAQPGESKGRSQSSRSTSAGAASTGADGLTRLGKYEIQKKLGAGGMGTVFLAIDPGLKRMVALKVLPKDKAGNPTLVKRFKAEAQAAANLRHDNIVMVYEAGEADGLLYIALEYVEGTDVANLVQKRGVMPVKRTLDVMRQVALGLDHARQQGIVHRDIKPGNILIRRDGVAKLADLGLARAVDDHADTSITRAGTTVGTVDYMSPEQARDSKAADIRSDIYSLGCTWYYMLTGEPPFPDGSMTNKLRAHAEVPLPDPRSKNQSVTEAVFAVMRRMTEKIPSRRHQTPAELISDLEIASLADNIVSEAILGELEGDGVSASRRKPSLSNSDAVDIDDSSGEVRPRKRPAMPSSDADAAGWKPFRQDRERQRFELGRAIPFYAIAALLVCGVVGGLALLVKQYGSTVDQPDRDSGLNPFASDAEPGDPQVIANARSGTTIEGNANSSASGAQGQGQGATYQGPATTIYTGTAVDQPPAAVVIGPGTVPPGASATGSGTDAAGSRVVGPVIDAPGVRITPQGTGASGTRDSGAGNGTTGEASTGTRSSESVEGSVATGSATGGRLTAPYVPRNPAAAVAAEKRHKQEEALLPAWSAPAVSTLELPKTPRLFVRRGVTENGRFPSLNAALAQVPTGGAIIMLEGSGPFPLRPATIAGKTRVVVRSNAEPGAKGPPLVLLQPAVDGPSANCIEFIGTAVELQGVHLGLAGTGNSATPPGTLLHVQGGDLILRDCSISMTGTSGPVTVAVRMSPPAGLPQGRAAPSVKVLLDQTVIRGNGLTSLLVESPADLVIRRSLLWSGAAPTLRFAGSAAASEQRTVRIASTTLSSGVAAVQVEGNPARPVATAFEWINSLITAPAGSASPALCVFQGWTPAQRQQALRKAFTWKSVDSLYLGWKSLLRHEPGSVSAAVDLADWLQVWNDRSAAAPGQFQDAAWPSRPVPDIVRAGLDLLAPETMRQQFVTTSEGGWPGCALADLTVGSAAALDSIQNAAARPQLPTGLVGGPSTGEVIRIDLTRDDLGKVLAGRKLQNGTQIIAFGFGQRQSSPIVIQNIWVRLSFEQIDGSPLVLSPRPVETARANDAGSRQDAFVSVVNGGIEIANGAFTVSSNERAQLPRWFIQVLDGDLALRNCRLQGPLLGTTRNKGLIQWVRADGRVATRPFAGQFEAYAAFDNCYLYGAGTLIEADLRQRALFIRDSVLVARDDLLAVNLQGVESQIAGAIDLESSTFSAAGSLVKVAAATLSVPTEAPLAVFADRCVFAPPLRNASQKAPSTLLAFSGPLFDRRELTWWESHCGYAPDIACFLREESAPPEPQEFQRAWLDQWGAGQVLAPLTGPQGVVLLKELPPRAEDRAKLEPTDFALHSASKAATWDEGVRPIGAPLGSLRVPSLRPSPAGTPPAKTKNTKPAPATPPTGSKPSF